MNDDNENFLEKTTEIKHKPNAIGIPENRTINVNKATIIAIIKGSINFA